MKRTAIAIASLLLLGCFLHKETFDRVRKQPKLTLETPPGCVWLRDSVFMDKSEVRNLDYYEFLLWLNRHDPELYQRMLPDTLVWHDASVYREPLVEYYLRHPAYRDYPVVGVSYEQAVEFCKWRSDRVNQFLYIRDHKLPKGFLWDTITHFPAIMRFRLPTKEEWEYAAAAGHDTSAMPFGYERITDDNNIPVTNTREYFNLVSRGTYFQQYIRPGCEGNNRTYDEADYTTNVLTGTPNAFGFYNMIGNVSELTADSTVKGYNYLVTLDGLWAGKPNDQPALSNSATSCIRKNFRYEGERAWIGFRCACDVLRPSHP